MAAAWRTAWTLRSVLSLSNPIKFLLPHLNSIQLDIDSFQQCRIKSFSAEMMLWHSTFVLAIPLIVIRLLNPFEDDFPVVDLIRQGRLKQHP